MNTQINNFCKNYLLKLKNDKDIKENKLDIFCDYRERISFNINMYKTAPGFLRINNHTENMFILDDEDLKYLYDKYSKKLQDELNENINKLKKEYNHEI